MTFKQTSPFRPIILLRHGEPAFSLNDKRPICLSKTDLPLSENGILQAKKAAKHLKETFPEQSFCVYASPLKRAIQTAQAFTPQPIICELLTEIDVGDWEGLSFHTIKEQYPKLYQKRGQTPFETMIPNAESPKDALLRSQQALSKILRQTKAIPVIVGHCGIFQLLLNHLLGQNPNDYLSLRIPYGSISIVTEEENQKLVVTKEQIGCIDFDGEHI